MPNGFEPEYQPIVDSAVWIGLIEIISTRSIGAGHAQCDPGPSNAFCPWPTGLPNRNTTALYPSFTVKNPEPRNSSTNPTIINFTMKKLLFSASDNARDPT